MRLAACLGALSSAPAFAQPAPAAPSNEQRATALFDEGTALYRKRKWAEAEAKFQASWDLRKAHDTAANLGDCEMYVGQHRDAAEHLDYASRTVLVSADDSVKQRLRARLAEAKREVATLEIKASEDGATVTVDDRPLGSTPLASEVFVDPGTHRVVAVLAGYKSAERRVDVAKGARQTLTLELSPEEAGPPVPATAATGLPPVQQPDVIPPERRRGSVAPGIVVAGVGAAGLVTGLVLLGVAGGKRSDAEALGGELQARNQGCQPPVAPSAAADCQQLADLNSEHDTFHDVGLAATIGGGAALAAGAIWIGYVLASPGAEDRPAASLRFAPTLGGARLIGTF